MVLCDCRIYEEYRRTCEWLICVLFVVCYCLCLWCWGRYGKPDCNNMLNVFDCHCRLCTTEAGHISCFIYLSLPIGILLLC